MRLGRSTAAWSLLRVIWCTYCTATTPSCPASTPPWNKHSQSPRVIAAVCRVQDIDAQNTPTYITRSYRKGTGIWTDALHAFAVSNRVRAPGIVVRRAAYERVGGYRTDLPHVADWEMWTRLAAHGPIVFVDQVLAVYRRHDASDSSARIRTGANIRERVAAIGVVCGHVPPDRQASTRRRALAYSVVFASRTALIGQGRQVVRCRPTGMGGRPLRVAAAAWRCGCPHSAEAINFVPTAD